MDLQGILGIDDEGRNGFAGINNAAAAEANHKLALPGPCLLHPSDNCFNPGFSRNGK